MELEWKTIEEAKGYAVSNNGDVINVRTGTYLKPRLDKDGYLRHNITSNGGHRLYVYVHRLVVLHFLGMPSEDKPCACHYNDLKTDNRAENLYWGSHQDNMRDKRVNGRYKKYCDKVEVAVKAMRAAGYTYADIVREYGMSLSSAYRICVGIRH